jgi:uncharacterized protein YejL (UPF0352 family)
MAINLRQSVRPVDEVIEELASEIIPVLEENKAARAA